MKLAELTSAGETKIEAAFSEHATLLGDLMDALSFEEKREAASVLRRVERSANEHEASSSTD